MAKVRLATEADAPALLGLGQAMHAESPRYRGRIFDPERVRQQIDLFTDGAQGRAGLLVVEVGGRLVGMAAVFAVEDWFGPGLRVVDRVIYIHPGHRGTTCFRRLVQAVEAWARERGIPDIDIGVSTGVQVEATVCAFVRQGYTLQDTRVVTKSLTNVHRT